MQLNFRTELRTTPIWKWWHGVIETLFMAIAYFYSRTSLLRSCEATRLCSRLIQVAYVTSLDWRPPRLCRKKTKFSFYMSPVPSVLFVATVKEPGFKRISVPSLYLTKGRSGSRLNSSWRGKFMFGNWTTACSLRIHIHTPFTVGPHWKMIVSVFGTERSVNSKRM